MTTPNAALPYYVEDTATGTISRYASEQEARDYAHQIVLTTTGLVNWGVFEATDTTEPTA